MIATICDQERAFRAALDERPGDIDLKRVFADWLEERGDWRAAGYRWMAENGKWPIVAFIDERDGIDAITVRCWLWNYSENDPDAHDVLPFALRYKRHWTRQQAEEWLCGVIEECQV